METSRPSKFVDRVINGQPVGATGVPTVLDGFKQVTGKAGDDQIEGARDTATLNIGGSVTSSVSFVIGR